MDGSMGENPRKMGGLMIGVVVGQLVRIYHARKCRDARLMAYCDAIRPRPDKISPHVYSTGPEGRRFTQILEDVDNLPRSARQHEATGEGQAP